MKGENEPRGEEEKRFGGWTKGLFVISEGGILEGAGGHRRAYRQNGRDESFFPLLYTMPWLLVLVVVGAKGQARLCVAGILGHFLIYPTLSYTHPARILRTTTFIKEGLSLLPILQYMLLGRFSAKLAEEQFSYYIHMAE